MDDPYKKTDNMDMFLTQIVQRWEALHCIQYIHVNCYSWIEHLASADQKQTLVLQQSAIENENVFGQIRT